METLAALCIGVCLSAACGMRVFVPMLALGVAAKLNILTPSHGFEWLGSWPALIAFTTAAILEMGASLFPWLDHAVDAIASPAAIICGTLATVAQIHDAGPLLTWSTGLALGGGAAAITQTTTVSTRAASTLTTGGLLNPILGAIQSTASAVLSVLAIALPVLATVLLAIIAIAAVVMVRRWKRARTRKATARALAV